MRDAVQAIVDRLAADSAVRALVGQDAEDDYRVCGDELKDIIAKEMPRAAIVVTRVPGGRDHGHMNLERGVVEVACFAETRKHAETLRQAARASLKSINRVVLSGTLLHSVTPTGAVLSTRDQDAKWPVSTESYEFLASETVVA